MNISSIASRILPASRLKGPDFLIIGTMKGGTTILYDFINMHPAFVEASQKEIHYFSLMYHKGRRWYLRHFPQGSRKITGEASPTYFDIATTLAIPNLIKAFNPRMKLILIVRDPIERAVSHYNHLVKINKVQQLESMGVDKFFGTPLEEVATQTTAVGYYLNQVLLFSSYYRKYVNFRQVFDAESILVLRNRDLKEKPYETMGKVFGFLGVKPIETEAFRSFKYSAGTNVDKLQPGTYDRLAGMLYPDYARFCAEAGIEYGELKPAAGHISVPRDVHLGKDGWMFLKGGSNNLIDYYNDDSLFGEVQVGGWLKLLKARVDYFEKLGIKYAHLVVPNKLTVYPEYYVDRLESFGSSPLQKLDRKVNEPGNEKVAAHFVNPAARYAELKKDAQLFWKTDTHWTFEGALAAYRLVCSKLGREPNEDLPDRDRQSGSLAMDLGSKCSPPVKETATFYVLQKDSRRVFANDIVIFKEENGLENNEGLHVGSNVVFENDSAPNPEKVVMFGDSFSEYRTHLLTGMFAETFREFHFVWSANIDRDYVDRVKPDIVITQTVERFMPVVPTDNFRLEPYCKEKLAGFKKGFGPGKQAGV